MTEEEAITLARDIPFKSGGTVRAIGVGSGQWPPAQGGEDYYAYAELWTKAGRTILRSRPELEHFVAGLSKGQEMKRRWTRRPGR
jgi:hypothetical protein